MKQDQQTNSRRRLATLLGASILATSLLGACHMQGGSLYSDDKHTYVSTSWRPWTVSLVDTRTGEAVWSMDVPVGRQLVVQFREGSGPNEFKPDMMDWMLMEPGRGGALRNQIPVPPASARRLEPVLRPTPEDPGALTASGG